MREGWRQFGLFALDAEYGDHDERDESGVRLRAGTGVLRGLREGVRRAGEARELTGMV